MGYLSMFRKKRKKRRKKKHSTHKSPSSIQITLHLQFQVRHILYQFEGKIMNYLTETLCGSLDAMDMIIMFEIYSF